ncbi:M20 family metallopeptidase [Actinomadura syzygii]|uniref:M20 family metallopeptidase n=2 Tax=Actinomadura syzygii TaxID=1427538 RepID=A0A5D0TSD3_9ACTN|nr:M20 family metallopeptidase [Actinomadura syzygii]
MESWLADHDLPYRRLNGPEQTPVALVSEIVGDRPGPRYVLDACLDTAPFGDETAWTFPPTSAEITDGWMHGRGSADSKVGAATFAHLAARLHVAGGFAGSLVLLFDVDEHSGGFGGAKSYFDGPDAPAHVEGVMIGYPGAEHVIVGGRGVLRAHVHVRGIAGHSGGSKTVPSAIAKAADLVTALHAAQLPATGGGDFPLPGKVTVTAINGGEGFSAVADLCVLNVDLRLTPSFPDQMAAGLLQAQTSTVDRSWPGTPATRIEISTRWPQYALPASSPLRTALLDAARAVGLAPTAKVAGPSNIGNYLAGLGIPATAGFGVDYLALHGTDERIRLDTIPQIQAAYHQALLALLT